MSSKQVVILNQMKEKVVGALLQFRPCKEEKEVLKATKKVRMQREG